MVLTVAPGFTLALVMQLQQLGRWGPMLSRIGLGTWALGGSGWLGSWGPQADTVSIATIHEAIDLGINWIDTAQVYGLGHSERVVAQALAARRDDVIVATKCVERYDASGPFISGSRRGVIEDCEASLRRLGVDVIDLYQIHHPPADVPIEEPWCAMVDLVEQGKVRYIGVCNLGLEDVRRCMAVRHVDSYQPPYSLLNRRVEAQILPYCQEHGIGVITYGAMEQGLLSGSFDPARIAGDDWRLGDGFQAKLQAGLELAGKLRPLACQLRMTVGQLAISWVLTHPSVTAVIVGARSVEQVRANLVPEPPAGLREAVRLELETR